MQSTTFEINGNRYQFINESGDTRNGFYHKSTLLVNGYGVADNKVNYLNRTWECYRYQTCMMGLVSSILSNRYEELLDRYKSENGISRLTKARREEFEKTLADDDRYVVYTELREKLH